MNAITPVGKLISAVALVAVSFAIFHWFGKQEPPAPAVNPLVNYALIPFIEDHQYLCQDREKRWYAAYSPVNPYDRFYCLAEPADSWEIPEDYKPGSFAVSWTCDGGGTRQESAQ